MLIPTDMWAEMMSATLIPCWLFRNKQYHPAGPDDIDDPIIYFDEDPRKAIIRGEVCHFDANDKRMYKGWKIYNTLYLISTYTYRIIYPDSISKKNRYIAVDNNGNITEGQNLELVKRAIREAIEKEA